MKIINHFHNIKYLSEDIFISDHPESKFIFCKPSRTVGSSIKRILKMENTNPYFRSFRKFGDFDWINNITDEELKNDYFKFTFVRNPFEKLVSVYRFGQMHPRKAFDVGNSFKEFLEEKLLDDDGYPVNGHWLPYSNYVECDGEIFVDFIGRYENIENDWNYIKDKIGINDNLPHDRSTGDYDYRSYYNKNTIDIVLEVYKRDFELFGYDF